MTTSCGAVYDVGPAAGITRLADVPWRSLKPGDVVRIAYRPEGYHEKIALTESGAIGNPIRIVGMPGPNGEKPVIDGAGATAAYGPDLFAGHPALESLGVITISRTNLKPYGYVPSNIEISGLEVRHATWDSTYTGADGVVRNYIDDGPSGIWAQGNNLVFRNNTLAFNGGGIFIGSKGTVGTASHNVLIDGNEFHGNGDDRPARTYRVHSVYAEGVHVVYQANDFKPMRPGSRGQHIKDRSAGTVIRYNHFSGGISNMIWLECAADNEALVANDPSYRSAFIYGNVFLSGPGESTVIVSAGDMPGNCPNQDVRNATLHFYANTVVLTKNKSGTDWASQLLFLNNPLERAELHDNIILVRPATPGATPTSFYLSLHPGTVHVGANWISAGWQPINPASAGYALGTVDVTGPVLNNATNDPGLANVAGGDVRLVAGGQAVDAGTAPPAATHPIDDVTASYAADRRTSARTIAGAAIDLGAYELDPAAPGPVWPSGTGGPAYAFPPLPAGATTGPTTTTSTSTHPISTYPTTTTPAP